MDNVLVVGKVFWSAKVVHGQETYGEMCVLFKSRSHVCVIQSYRHARAEESRKFCRAMVEEVLQSYCCLKSLFSRWLISQY